MPQNPIVAQPGGTQTTLNITAPTIIKATPGRLFTISVTVDGSDAGAVYDSKSTSGNSASNQTVVIPNTAGVIDTNAFPHANGIVIAPGTDQTVSVAWS